MKELKLLLFILFLSRFSFSQKSIPVDTFPFQVLIVKGNVKVNGAPVKAMDFLKIGSSVKMRKNGFLAILESNGTITEITKSFHVAKTISTKNSRKALAQSYYSDSHVRELKFVDRPSQAVVRRKDFNMVNFDKLSNMDRVYIQDSILIDWKTTEHPIPDTFNISIENIFEDPIITFQTTNSQFHIHKKDNWFESEGNVVIIKIQAEGKRTYEYGLRQEVYPVNEDASYLIFLQEAITNEKANNWSGAEYCFKMAINRAANEIKQELKHLLILHKKRYWDYEENHFDPYSY